MIGVGVEQCKRLLQRQHESAGRAQLDAGDDFRERERLIAAGARIEAMDLPALNIDPVQPLLPGMPCWRLADDGLTRQHTRDGRAGDRLDMRRWIHAASCVRLLWKR